MLQIQKQSRNRRGRFFLCSNQGSILTNLMPSISMDELSLTGIVFIAEGDPRSSSFCPPQPPDHGIPTLIITKDIPRQTLQSTRTNPFLILIKLPGSSHFPSSPIMTRMQQQQWLSRCILEFAEAECWRRECLQSQSTMCQRSKL